MSHKTINVTQEKKGEKVVLKKAQAKLKGGIGVSRAWLSGNPVKRTRGYG